MEQKIKNIIYFISGAWLLLVLGKYIATADHGIAVGVGVVVLIIIIIIFRARSKKKLMKSYSSFQTSLTSRQIKKLKSIRDAVPKPTASTLMQKVIPDVMIEIYFDPDYVPKISGYIFRYVDIAHIKTASHMIKSLCLNYPNTRFGSTKAYGVIRFHVSNPNVIVVPYGYQFGGIHTESLPCPMNGFSGARNGEIVPEFKINQASAEFPKDGAQLYRVDKDGAEVLIGEFDADLRRFVRVK